MKRQVFCNGFGGLVVTGTASTLAGYLTVEVARDTSYNFLRFLPLFSYLALIAWSGYLSHRQRSPHATSALLLGALAIVIGVPFLSSLQPMQSDTTPQVCFEAVALSSYATITIRLLREVAAGTWKALVLGIIFLVGAAFCIVLITWAIAMLLFSLPHP